MLKCHCEKINGNSSFASLWEDGIPKAGRESYGTGKQIQSKETHGTAFSKNSPAFMLPS